MGWLETRSQMRRTLHAAFAVPATYEDSTVVVPVSITVRWHSKQERVGNIAGGDYAEVVETIDRLIFDSEEMAAKGLTVARGGLIKLTTFGDYQLELDVREPLDGPIKVVWTVIRP